MSRSWQPLRSAYAVAWQVPVVPETVMLAAGVPTLFVWSTNDQAPGRTAAERTARHVEGRYRFEVLEGVSHWIPETEPSRVATLIRQHALAQR